MFPVDLPSFYTKAFTRSVRSQEKSLTAGCVLLDQFLSTLQNVGIRSKLIIDEERRNQSRILFLLCSQNRRTRLQFRLKKSLFDTTGCLVRCVAMLLFLENDKYRTMTEQQQPKRPAFLFGSRTCASRERYFMQSYKLEPFVPVLHYQLHRFRSQNRDDAPAKHRRIPVNTRGWASFR